MPVFPSRAFRHSFIAVNTDRIKKPSDLNGKKIGSATLKDGRAVMWLKKNVAVGMHHIVATYKGDANNWWSRDRLRFWVVR